MIIVKIYVREKFVQELLIHYLFETLKPHVESRHATLVERGVHNWNAINKAALAA